jgi:hypothetical protein
LIESVADWNVEVGNFAVVERVAGGRLVEGVLVMEDTLLEVMDLILILLCCNGGGGLSVCRSPLAMLWRNVASMSGCDWRVFWMV